MVLRSTGGSNVPVNRALRLAACAADHLEY
jgi:hypothetical protein